MRRKVLLVEDDASLADVVAYNLAQSGYEVEHVVDGRQALEAARRKLPDLVILDLMLPIIDGLEVCRRLRADEATRELPVLMLTAKAEESDELVGFNMGADDYVTKPFSVKVLLERVKAIMRRKQAAQETDSHDIAASQGIELDRTRHRATADGRVLPLTLSEFRLLDTLIRRPGRVFGRMELIDAALGGDALAQDRTIDVHVRGLRRKLGEQAHLVETVRGLGYRFRDPADQEVEAAVR